MNEVITNTIKANYKNYQNFFINLDKSKISIKEYDEIYRRYNRYTDLYRKSLDEQMANLFIV